MPMYKYKATALICLAPLSAMAVESLTVSSRGLGAAKFGTQYEEVEKAIDRKFVFTKAALATGPSKVVCTDATVAGLPRVKARLETGRFVSVDITTPAMATMKQIRKRTSNTLFVSFN